MTDFLGNELNLGDDVVYVFFCKTSRIAKARSKAGTLILEVIKHSHTIINF